LAGITTVKLCLLEKALCQFLFVSFALVFRNGPEFALQLLLLEDIGQAVYLVFSKLEKSIFEI